MAEKLPACQLGAKEKQSWYCRFCDQIETNVVKYAKHLQKHYQKMIENLYTCYICNEGFSTQNVSNKNCAEITKWLNVKCLLNSCGERP